MVGGGTNRAGAGSFDLTPASAVRAINQTDGASALLDGAGVGAGEVELPPPPDGPNPRPPRPPWPSCGQLGSWLGDAGAVAAGLVVLVVLSSVVWA